MVNLCGDLLIVNSFTALLLFESLVLLKNERKTIVMGLSGPAVA